MDPFPLLLASYPQAAVNAVLNHTSRHGDAPLFMYYALHNTHGPVCARFPLLSP